MFDRGMLYSYVSDRSQTTQRGLGRGLHPVLGAKTVEKIP